MQLDWVFGVLFILAIVFLIAFYLSVPEQSLLIWPGVILVIILIVYLVAHYQHSQGWKVGATLALVIFLAAVVIPGSVASMFWPVPSPIPTQKI